jgi:hypothetical protein
MRLDEIGFAGHRSLTAQGSMRELFYDFTNVAITSLTPPLNPRMPSKPSILRHGTRFGGTSILSLIQ